MIRPQTQGIAHFYSFEWALHAIISVKLPLISFHISHHIIMKNGSRFISCHSSCQGWVTCLWGWSLGHQGPDSFLKASSFVTIATSQHQHPNSSNETIITIPMPCQCQWQSPYGPLVPFDSSLQFHGLAAAICLSMLKAAVFTYSLFPLLWILSLVFTAGQSHIFFQDPY